MSQPPPTGVLEARLVITTADFERAIGFYRDTLGLTLLQRFDTDRGAGVILDCGRATLEILDEDHAAFVDEVEVGTRVAGTLRLALEVADAAATTEALSGAGAEILAAPTLTPWGSTNSRLRDADGVQLTIFSEDADESAWGDGA